MRNYLLFILLIIICIKSITTNYEYMTDFEQKVNNLRLMGYEQSVAEQIINQSSTICAIPNDINTTYIGYPPELNTNEKSELIFKDYKLKIESGQDFHNKLNNLEELVFIDFYGPQESKWKPIYERWKQERSDNIDNQLVNKCNDILSANSNGETITEKIINEKIKTLSFLEKINKDMYSNNYLYGSNSEDANISIRKMQYRSGEEDKIELYNNYINWIYYLIFITMLILLYSQSKLNLIKNFMIYIFLLLLPVIIYPYIFKLCKFIIEYIYKTTSNEMPQNAFMNN